MPETRQFPFQATWLVVLALIPTLGLVALGLAGVELIGLVPRGALLGEASDAERIAAVVLGALALPFGVSALLHARLVIDPAAIHYLGFAFVCRRRSIAFDQIGRHGVAATMNRGRRERILLLELADRSVRTIKLSMYRDQDEILRLLQARLGPAAATSASMTGVRFADPA